MNNPLTSKLGLERANTLGSKRIHQSRLNFLNSSGLLDNLRLTKRDSEASNAMSVKRRTLSLKNREIRKFSLDSESDENSKSDEEWKDEEEKDAVETEDTKEESKNSEGRISKPGKIKRK